MITRRHMIYTGASVALAGSGLAWSASLRAQAAGLALSPALPQGLRDNAVLEALPGKKPLIKLSYRPPNYETPIEYFRTAITPERRVLRALPPRRHSRGRRQELDARGRRRRRQRQHRTQPRRSPEGFQRSRSPPSASARATGAGCSSRTCPASNGATAQWATRAGRASRLEGCAGQGRLARRRRSRSPSTAPTGRCCRQTPDFVKSIPIWQGARGHDASSPTR